MWTELPISIYVRRHETLHHVFPTVLYSLFKRVPNSSSTPRNCSESNLTVAQVRSHSSCHTLNLSPRLSTARSLGTIKPCVCIGRYLRDILQMHRCGGENCHEHESFARRLNIAHILSHPGEAIPIAITRLNDRNNDRLCDGDLIVPPSNTFGARTLGGNLCLSKRPASFNARISAALLRRRALRVAKRWMLIFAPPKFIGAGRTELPRQFPRGDVKVL